MSDWRPFEPSKEAVKVAVQAAAENTCNLHDNCRLAEAAYQKRYRHAEIPAGFHCHDEDCEDCFGC